MFSTIKDLICGQVMDSSSLLGPRFIPERVASHGMDYTTHFERRARLQGQPITEPCSRNPRLGDRERRQTLTRRRFARCDAKK